MKRKVRRILLVEDDPSISDVVQVVLADDGYHVHAAPDGEAALSAARMERFGIVLLDMVVPGPSGKELIGALRPHLGATPILLLTASRDGAELARTARLADYLAKPFDVDALLERVIRLYSPL
jgi:DNA-binding response OmpR family regulator